MIHCAAGSTSRRPILTPARFVCAVAAIAITGNACLLIAEALEGRDTPLRSSTPSSVQAARGYLPGERTSQLQAAPRTGW